MISTPTLPVSDLREAIELYERAGFGVRVCEDDEGNPGEGFAFVDLDGQSYSISTCFPSIAPVTVPVGT